ncbi:uncharacterized protein KQ657_005258 [Scheffersomyces spartinae]|uniref:Large ribosomal subunit protein mL50 n=1 Tax=Scheffersomyces spartinae TaxID=45513 RepID=A0A9P8AIU6_9ASCO|nr:uncharacterized protein KQ657_005258 [Scheffersomyces spartinae]KAG7194055.1 hypothetical protein KQ657_005258 [Scheffersomyces spartinae]
MWKAVARRSRPGHRLVSVIPRRSLFENFFRKTVNKEQLIEKQDEAVEEGKIVFLTEQNSPSNKKAEEEIDAVNFKINQWRDQTVHPKDFEQTFSGDKLSTIINETYNDLKQTSISSPTEYSALELTDLNFRFTFTKELQRKLGFLINDYTISSSHNVDTLYKHLSKLTNKRWVSETNPNGISLRAEDFTAPNIYLNQEVPEVQQEKLYQDLLAKANQSTI